MGPFRSSLCLVVVLMGLSLVAKIYAIFMFTTAKKSAYLLRASSYVKYGEFAYVPLEIDADTTVIIENCEGSVDVYLSRKAEPTTEEYDFHMKPQQEDAFHIKRKLGRPVYMGLYGFGDSYNKYNLSVLFHESLHPALEGSTINELLDHWMAIGFIWSYLEFFYSYAVISYRYYNDIMDYHID